MKGGGTGFISTAETGFAIEIAELIAKINVIAMITQLITTSLRGLAESLCIKTGRRAAISGTKTPNK